MRGWLEKSWVIAAAAVWAVNVHAGPDWIEEDHGDGDAGGGTGNSQPTSGTGGTLLKITGKLGGVGLSGIASGFGDYEDMYLIYISDPQSFCATTVPCGPNGCGSAEFDTKLWLFDANGLGLLGNNDTPISTALGAPVVSGSTLGPFACDETEASVVEPGLYYLAISYNNEPLNGSGPIFTFDDAITCGPGEISGPDGPGGGLPIIDWTPNVVEYEIQVLGGRAGDYANAFTIAGLATPNAQVVSNQGSLDDPSEFEDWNISWNFGSDADATIGQAHIGSGFVLENTMPEDAEGAADLHFIVRLKLNVFAPVGPSIVAGNSAVTLLTRPSMTSSPGVLSSVDGPVWAGLINQEDAASIFPHPYELSGPATPFTGSTSVDNGNVPSFAFGDNVDSLGVRLDFTLTPGEKVSFIGMFAMLPVAEGAGTPQAPGNYVISLCGTAPAIQQVELPMDIKPGGCPNPFNPGSHGVLPVSLLGTTAIDIGNVILSSVRMTRPDGQGGFIGSLAPHEGPPGPHSTYDDTGTPFEGDECECHQAHGDGITDLSMKFVTDDIVDELELGDVPGGSVIEINLVGELTSGEEFIARDCIWIVPPQLTNGNLVVRSNRTDSWVDVSVADQYLDAGGFGPSFSRTYQPHSSVKLTAQTWPGGPAFKGWRLKSSKQLVTSQTLKVQVGGKAQTVEAVYDTGPGGISD